MKHLDEASLFETCYLPVEDAETRRHLEDCELCSDRLARLRDELDHCSAQLHDSVSRKPETFWARQRLGIQRRIAAGASEPARRRLSVRASLAAAATIALLITGTSFIYRNVTAPETAPLVATTTHEAAAPVDFFDEEAAELSQALFEDGPANDPWASDEIADFRSVVEWESWLDNEVTSFGGTS